MATSGEQTKMANATTEHDQASRPVAVIVGSNNPQTRAQLTTLAETKAICNLDLEDMSFDRVANCLRNGKHIVVRVRWGRAVASAVDNLLKACQHEGISGFILAGGDTAQLVCDHCRADGLWMEGEILPGLPWGRLDKGLFDGLPVATKAGGFGDADALARLVDWLVGLPNRGNRGSVDALLDKF